MLNHAKDSGQLQLDIHRDTDKCVHVHLDNTYKLAHCSRNPNFETRKTDGQELIVSSNITAVTSRKKSEKLTLPMITSSIRLASHQHGFGVNHRTTIRCTM